MERYLVREGLSDKQMGKQVVSWWIPHNKKEPDIQVYYAPEIFGFYFTGNFSEFPVR